MNTDNANSKPPFLNLCESVPHLWLILLDAPISRIDKFLDEIGQDRAAAAVQVDAVGVESPAFGGGDFVEGAVQHAQAEGIAVHGKDSDVPKTAARLGLDLGAQR